MKHRLHLPFKQYYNAYGSFRGIVKNYVKMKICGINCAKRMSRVSSRRGAIIQLL